jgi:hypothetical protein
MWAPASAAGGGPILISKRSSEHLPEACPAAFSPIIIVGALVSHWQPWIEWRGIAVPMWQVPTGCRLEIRADGEAGERVRSAPRSMNMEWKNQSEPASGSAGH